MRTSSATMFEAIGRAGPSRQETVARLDALATLLDSAVVLPGTNVRLGLDALIGLVPGIGDAVSAILSGYIVWEARRLGLPRWKIARMIANVALDSTLGAVPLVGDAFDVAFKANRRNMKILREHLAGEAGPGVIDAEYKVVRDGR